MNKQKLFYYIIFSAITLYFTSSCTHVFAQDAQKKSINSPVEEKFEPADGLIETVYPINKQMVNLYNSDGSIWYKFNLDKESPYYYGKNIKPEFKPFTPMEILEVVSIRIKECSENWCGVIVNEKTQEIKFVQKQDKSLAWQSIEETILNLGSISYDLDKNSVFESPEKNPRKIENLGEYKIYPLEFNGDWLKIKICRQGCNVNAETGWIKWKEGRKILVEYILNNPKLYL